MTTVTGWSAPTPAPTASTRREGRALGWLTAGLVLGPVGLVVGWYHVLTAPRWPVRDKVLAALLPVPVVGLLFAVGGGVGGYGCTRVDTSAEVCESHPPAVIAWAGVLALAAVPVLMVVHLRRVARRGQTHPVTSRRAALVTAVAAVALVAALADWVGRLGSYDYHADVVAAANEADASGEYVGVVSTATADDWMTGTEVSRADLADRAGPGNRRLDAIFDRLVAETDDPPLEPNQTPLEPVERDRPPLAATGACFVFPVIDGDLAHIEDAIGLMRVCSGPSQARSYRSLSDR